MTTGPRHWELLQRARYEMIYLCTISWNNFLRCFHHDLLLCAVLMDSDLHSVELVIIKCLWRLPLPHVFQVLDTLHMDTPASSILGTMLFRLCFSVLFAL